MVPRNSIMTQTASTLPRWTKNTRNNHTTATHLKIAPIHTASPLLRLERDARPMVK